MHRARPVVSLARAPVQPVRAVARPNRTRRRSANPPSLQQLSTRLFRLFETHTATVVGGVAQDRLEDAAAGFANACVSLVPAANAIPGLRLLTRELAKRLARQARANNRVAAFVRRCGPRQAAALLALSVATFMHRIAQDWGSPLTLEDVVALLLEYMPVIAGFIAGRSVDLKPLFERLLSRRSRR